MKRSAHTRGEVWWANLSPAQGHEQGGDRPCIVMSGDGYNVGASSLVVVVPCTRTISHRVPMHVAYEPPEAGFTEKGVALCDHLRSISKTRLRRFQGEMSGAVIAVVEDRLRILLDL